MQNLIETVRLLSRHSKMDCKHACVITKGKTILAAGVNHHGNRVLGKTVPTIHAEMGAFSSFCKLNKYRSLFAARKQWLEKAGYLYCQNKL